MTRPNGRFPAMLAALYAAWFVALAIHPHDRADWLLENALALALVAVLIGTRRAFPLSNVSYAMLFVFLVLHTLGAHYTYSRVPYDEWCRAMTGRTLSDLLHWERNHYDRLVHLSYGLLLVYPMREVFLRVADARGFWGYFLPLDLTLSTSAVYELIEWAAAAALGGDLGAAYLGTQGDEWDAQKDMALAMTGALAATLVIAAIDFRARRDFAREFVESLRVKQRAPLGADAPAEGAAGRGPGAGRQSS